MVYSLSLQASTYSRWTAVRLISRATPKRSCQALFRKTAIRSAACRFTAVRVLLRPCEFVNSMLQQALRSAKEPDQASDRCCPEARSRTGRRPGKLQAASVAFTGADRSDEEARSGLARAGSVGDALGIEAGRFEAMKNHETLSFHFGDVLAW